MFIDADSHVDECPDTWSYFPKAMAHLRPAEMVFLQGEQPKFLKNEPTHGWFIDGLIYHRNVRDDNLTGTKLETRELYDVGARIRDLDNMGVDVQVLYPTLLLYEITKRPELDVAICESYNRWISDRCSESEGRLRWVAALPFRSIPDALREMRRAKETGAIGVFKRGFECDERRASDAYFDPIYDLARELDLPICLHASRPFLGLSNGLTKTQLGIYSSAYIQDAFLTLLMGRTASKFPKLRFGFIEAGAGWLPYLLWLARFDAHLVTDRPSAKEISSARERFEELLIERQFFITCESTENLSALINQIGDSSLCVGSDYGHADRASVRRAHEDICKLDDLEQQSAQKITTSNGKRLYGLP